MRFELRRGDLSRPHFRYRRNVSLAGGRALRKDGSSGVQRADIANLQKIVDERNYFLIKRIKGFNQENRQAGRDVVGLVKHIYQSAKEDWRDVGGEHDCPGIGSSSGEG